VTSAAGYPVLALYFRLIRQARPYWPHLAGCLALGLLASPLVVLNPLPWKIAFDSGLGSEPLPGFLEALRPVIGSSTTAVLVLAGGLILAIALLTQLQTLASSLLQSYTSEKLVLDFRAQMFAHIQRLSLAYHDTRGTADGTYRIQYDARSIENILVTGMIPLVTAACTVIGMIYVTARVDSQLALVALVVAPALFLISQLSIRRLRAGWHDVKAHESAAMSVVQEVLSAVRIVKAFGQEKREHDRFVSRSSQGVRGKLELSLLQGMAGLFTGLTLAAGTAAVLFVGVHHIQASALTVGELVMVMLYLSQMYAPLATASRKAGDVQASLASADRAFAMLDENPDVTERPHARPLARAAGAIAFHDVSFGYDSDRMVLRDITFDVSPGTRVGISGTTGAGKTTLVSLLTRFYDPTNGHISLDGIDIREYRLIDLRNQFAIVLQEPVLFSTSIAENITYARPGAKQDEIIAASRAANAHEFIAALPDGYETRVGERGMRLSGGERQRISLARAFLKDAPILILDEPTSSVDAATETTIAEAMERLMQGRTSFVISHRLSMLERSDILLVMDGGQLASLAACAKTLVAEDAWVPTQ
jgi:ATP-binding cassette, subfamily B, bacterial